MIYSVPKPAGGFEYYSAPQEHYIGDDLPPFQYRSEAGIGTPAYELGRRLPAGAQRVGEGEIPRGLLTPMRRLNGALSGAGDTTPRSYLVLSLLGISMGVVGYFAGRTLR